MNTHTHANAARRSATPRRRARGKHILASTLAATLTVSGLSMALTSLPAASAATEIDLGTARQFAVLAGAGVTNTNSTTIQTQDAGVRGDVGTFPNNTVTGDSSISWIPPATGSFHKADATAQNAQADNLIAYNAAAGAASNSAIGGQLDNMEFVAGVHTASSALNLATNGTVTFNAQNDPDAEFIIQVGSSLTMEVNSTVALTNGAQACHIFWQVGEDATVMSNADFIGTLMAENAIVAQSGASFIGRLLAQNASVTLDNNTFTMPGCSPRVIPTDTEADTTADSDSTDTDSSTDVDSDSADADSDSDTTDADADAAADSDSDTTDADTTADSDSDSADGDTDSGSPVPEGPGTPGGALPPSVDTPLPDTGGLWLGFAPIGMALIMMGASAISMSKRPRGAHRA
ncbi:ice-binding family protein [Aeromicrobium sp.]|uniref:ice-binding family protein n=1 Tax=Aeromicrobium sp. TaxID=1871063 RepID=UPI002FC7A5EB